VTKDIAAVFEPKRVIHEAATEAAEELGLPFDWLNDAVNRFLPGEDADRVAVPDIRGIEITTASPRYLLAMKLMAMRFGEDDEDIQFLLRECGIRSAGEALALVEHMYPAREPPVKTRFFLEELFGDTSQDP
jgi:hypothetical protein